MNLATLNTVEPPNNGHGGDEHFVHCSEVVPLSEVLPLSTIIMIISLVCESQFIHRLLHIIIIYVYMYIVHCHIICMYNCKKIRYMNPALIVSD